MIPTVTCQYCGWQGSADQCGPLRNAWERVQPGDPMPAGECPIDDCPGCAMLDHPNNLPEDLRPALVALMLDLNRLHDTVSTHILNRPIAAQLKELAAYANNALGPTPPLQPVCNLCHSTGVLVDAWAAWDIENQCWELHSTYEPTSICTDCDAECSYSMKPLPITT